MHIISTKTLLSHVGFTCNSDAVGELVSCIFNILFDLRIKQILTINRP